MFFLGGGVFQWHLTGSGCRGSTHHLRWHQREVLPRLQVEVSVLFADVNQRCLPIGQLVIREDRIFLSALPALGHIVSEVITASFCWHSIWTKELDAEAVLLQLRLQPESTSCCYWDSESDVIYHSVLLPLSKSCADTLGCDPTHTGRKRYFPEELKT